MENLWCPRELLGVSRHGTGWRDVTISITADPHGFTEDVWAWCAWRVDPVWTWYGTCAGTTRTDVAKRGRFRLGVSLTSCGLLLIRIDKISQINKLQLIFKRSSLVHTSDDKVHRKYLCLSVRKEFKVLDRELPDVSPAWARNVTIWLSF